MFPDYIHQNFALIFISILSLLRCIQPINPGIQTSYPILSILCCLCCGWRLRSWKVGRPSTTATIGWYRYCLIIQIQHDLLRGLTTVVRMLIFVVATTVHVVWGLGVVGGSKILRCRVSVRTFLFMTKFVVVCPETSSTELARIRFFTWKQKLEWNEYHIWFLDLFIRIF